VTRRTLPLSVAFCLSPLAFFVSSCGYHIAGRADLVPKDVHTIAVTNFTNATTRYKLADRLTASVGREFLSRTRYRVVADPNQADATLTGGVSNVLTLPIVSAENRSTVIQVIVMLHVELKSRTGAVIYSRPNFEFRERYEISVSPQAYFEESDAAMERLSRDVARTVVSSILEAF
jgi:Lipopolysaccharide-assembly